MFVNDPRVLAVEAWGDLAVAALTAPDGRALSLLDPDDGKEMLRLALEGDIGSDAIAALRFGLGPLAMAGQFTGDVPGDTASLLVIQLALVPCFTGLREALEQVTEEVEEVAHAKFVSAESDADREWFAHASRLLTRHRRPRIDILRWNVDAARRLPLDLLQPMPALLRVIEPPARARRYRVTRSRAPSSRRSPTGSIRRHGPPARPSFNFRTPEVGRAR